ncbi:MAG: hypothetical protein AB7E85_01920 [Pseudobdellovibrionaceae bacterium]
MKYALAAWILTGVLWMAGGSPLLAQEFCVPDKAPTIIIKPVETRTQFNNDRSFLSLSNMKSDTVSPYAHDAILHTFGLASTNFQMSWTIAHKGQANRYGGQACIWYDAINFNITMKPMIYVASEYPPNSCQYKEVMKHERMHLEADRQVINKYMQILGKELYDAMGQQYVYGPFPLAQKEAMFTQMSDRVTSIVTGVKDRMQVERRQMQSQVDSLQNYEQTAATIKNVCDKQYPNVAKARDYKLQQYMDSLQKRRKI